MRRPISEETKREKRNELKKTLKSMIFPLILALLIAVGVFVIITYQNKEEEVELVEIESYAGESKEMVLENDSLKFTFDPLTTHFDLLVKKTGKVWHSNPDGIENDSLAMTEEKGKLNSTMIVVYSVETGLQTTLNNYNYSITNGIYDVEEGDGYIKVDYSIGKVEKEYILPPVTTETKFKDWLSKMDNTGTNFVQQYYKKYDIKKLGKKDNKEELLESYPIIADEVIYVLRDSANENVKKSVQKYFAEAGYEYEDYIADKELDSSAKVSDVPIFTASMIYKLDGDDLVVEVPMSSFTYREKYPIYTFSMLPYFGAGGKEDNGYLVVPEGGGATINFNNGKIAQSAYYANLYGWDRCISRDAVVHDTRAYFNAFGVAHEDGGMICTIDEGSSYAAVQADVAGKTNNFNYVNAVYSICSREKYDVGDVANSDIYTYIESLPQDESLVQRYSFSESGDYVDMAKTYSKYLMNKYPELTKNNDMSTPVAVEIVGAVDKVKQIVGVPVSMPLPLTTYKEAEAMIETLVNEDGIDNLSVKMSGWCNGGVKQQVLNHVKPIHSLGSNKDLTNLINSASDMGVDLYLNGMTAYAQNSNIFDGFFSFTDAAKLLSLERAAVYKYSPVTYAERDGLEPGFLLHTDVALEMLDNLTEYCQKKNVNISLEDIGVDLASDFYKKDTRSRESVLNSQVEKLKNIGASDSKLMINMGNDYAIAYSDIVTNMDLRGSEYTILDEFIPFYQLAIHGYVNYTGEPINISGNDVDELLYSAEYGAGLSYTFMNESAFALQKTLYTEYYGSEFAKWHERMTNMYSRYNKELGHVFNQEMTGHKNLNDNVAVTEYEDGTKVYVNYGFSDYQAGEVNVPARDYLVIR